MFELHITNSTDKQLRFQVLVEGQDSGELMMSREALTRLADRLFGSYKIIQNGVTYTNNKISD